VFRRYVGRIAVMLIEDDPLYPNWDQDASAVDPKFTVCGTFPAQEHGRALPTEAGEFGEDLAAILSSESARPWRPVPFALLGHVSAPLLMRR
jgi:hypothetical protein